VIAAVVLAAGASTRFGSPKQRLLLQPVLERVRASSSLDEVVVVLGAHDVDTDARTVRCPQWERGPGASLRCGLSALGDAADAAVVVLADGPELAPQAIDRVVAAWRAGGSEILAATYDGQRSHPVLVARSRWSDVPDEGLRAMVATPVPCDDLRPPGDVDYPEDLARGKRGFPQEPRLPRGKPGFPREPPS
jgi:nicotine blue oxidoreductase